MSAPLACSAPAHDHLDAGGHASTSRGTPAWLAATAIMALAAFAGLVAFAWVGVIGSDDSLYWAASSGWLEHVPFVGSSHWALRHPMVVPIALSRLALGDGPAAIALPTLLYAGGVVLVAVLWAGRAAGAVAAAFTAIVLVTNPQLVIETSTPNIDAAEAFFVVASLALLHRAFERTRTRPDRPVLATLLLAGVLAGCGMLVRETTAFAVAALIPLFLLRYGMQRSRYITLAAGFALVVGTEFLLLWRLTGQFFYRSSISAHHDSTIDRWVDQGASVPIIHPAIDPFTMLLLNHNFGAVFWVGVPLSVVLLRSSRPASATRTLATLLATVTVVWTLIAAELWRFLPLTPRYFLLPSLLVCIMAGLALASLWQGGRRRTAAAIAAALVAINLMAVSLDNRNYMFAEHALATMSSGPGRLIHTDPQTLRRASLFLQWQGTPDRLTSEPPIPGSLAYTNPARGRQAIVPAPDWVVVERRPVPLLFWQWVAKAVLPPRLMQAGPLAYLRPPPDVVLYAVP